MIALIDDSSRLVTGAGVFFEDTFANLMSVMKGAVAKYGVPRMFNFDYTDVLTIPTYVKSA